MHFIGTLQIKFNKRVFMKGKILNDKDNKWITVEKECKHQYLFYDVFKCKINNGYCRLYMKNKEYCQKIPVRRGLMKWT